MFCEVTSDLKSIFTNFFSFKEAEEKGKKEGERKRMKEERERKRERGFIRLTVCSKRCDSENGPDFLSDDWISRDDDSDFFQRKKENERKKKEEKRKKKKERERKKERMDESKHVVCSDQGRKTR